MIWSHNNSILKKRFLFKLLTLLSVALLTNCGYDKSYEGVEESLYFSQDAISGGVPLTDTQLAVALRVCYAFRSKRSKFSVELLGSSFTFAYTVRECSSDETTTNIDAILTEDSSSSSGALRYDSSFVGNYIDEVQTDTHGYLSAICSSVLAGDTPLNISEINNELYEYSFKSTSSKEDQVSISIGSPQTINSEIPTVTQKLVFEVQTSANIAGDYHGMLSEAKRYLPCSNDTAEIKLYKQTFEIP